MRAITHRVKLRTSSPAHHLQQIRLVNGFVGTFVVAVRVTNDDEMRWQVDPHSECGRARKHAQVSVEERLFDESSLASVHGGVVIPAPQHV
jgi:hypothetical protein